MMDKKKDLPKVDWRIVCVSLACITVLELYALSQGVNGLILTTVIAIIAGIAGYITPSRIKIK